MKRLMGCFLATLCVIGFTACQATPTGTSSSHIDDSSVTNSVNGGLLTQQDDPKYYNHLGCSKDFVDNFMDILENDPPQWIPAAVKLDRKQCYNVTPAMVASQTDYKLFKFGDSCLSLVLIDGKVYPLCEYSGGYGFTDAAPWDYDQDGNIDLLVSSSWGEDVHRSAVSVFNTVTKESIPVYDTSFPDNPDVALLIRVQSPSVAMEDLPLFYPVYAVKIKTFGEEKNWADLYWEFKDVLGAVETENGNPIFKPFQPAD